MRRALMVGVAAFAVVAFTACGGGSDDAASTTTSSPATVPSTSATTPASVAPVVPSAPFTIPMPTDGVSANGSGCAPPPGDTLPDGIWFGDLKSVDVSANTVSLDLNCYFQGDAANHAAAQDGQQSPVEDDYYIRNQVMKIYVLPAVANVAAFELPDMGGNPNPAPAGNGAQAVATMLQQFNNAWVGWLQISGGKVVAVQQQFRP